MEQFSQSMQWALAGVLVAYMSVMYVVGYLAQRQINDVEDYLVAGRNLSGTLACVTIVATWFGAESLMTATDEVSQLGIRRAMMDPVGISVCLLIAGLCVARPLWRMNLLTVPDFFLKRYGKSAEILASLILVPSYFGWVAAQFVALATILCQCTPIDFEFAVIAIAILGTGYAIMGGMWSITWTDVIQMVFIVAGLIVLGYEIIDYLGRGDLLAGIHTLRSGPSESHWQIASAPNFSRDIMLALSALAIGALGNLPVQDLLQRIQSAKSERVAQRACLAAAVVYFTMGLMPVGAGLAAALILPTVPEAGVVTALAQQLLSPALLLLFMLAIVSTVLSTIVSAVMAPAAIVAHNLIEPAVNRFFGALLRHQQLTLQRCCVVGITVASTLLALSGARAYELVQASYAMSLVGLCVPFLFGLYYATPNPMAAIAAILAGTVSWALHVLLSWDDFLQPYVADPFRVPHALVDTLFSAAAFALLNSFGGRESADSSTTQSATG